MSDGRPEQIRDYFGSIADNLAPAIVSSWLQQVAKNARELCPDTKIEFRPTSTIGEIVMPTKDAIRYVIKSTKDIERQAPDVIRVILAAYREDLERQL